LNPIVGRALADAFGLTPGSPLVVQLQSAGTETAHAAGALLVEEGAEADAVFVVLEGQVEVLTRHDGQDLPLGTRGPGQLVGETAFVQPDRRRTASVRALTPVRLAVLPARSLEELLRASPDAGVGFARAADQLVIGNFIRSSTPFGAMTREQAAWLSARVERLRVPAGTVVVEQGSRGDRCYLLQRGRIEVLLAGDDGSEEPLATLEAGALIGEISLLTDEPRNATARAVVDCELLSLAREDLLASLRESEETRRRLTHLVQWRDRPCRARGIVEATRPTADGTEITVLKDPARLAYYQLTPEGLFIWRSLDGRQTLRGLVMRYLKTHGRLAPQRVHAIVDDLARAGFLVSHRLAAPVAGDAPALRWARRLSALRSLRLEIGGIDAHLAAAYRRWGKHLYRPVVLGLLALLALGGLAAFVIGMPGVGAVFSSPTTHPAVLLLAYPALALSLVLHELAHAMTTKHYGREVHQGGVGLFYFAPVAFVDTSDMWLEPRGRRNAVNLAGVAANAVVAGVASLAAAWVDDPTLVLGLWLAALANYATIAANLNPMIELDGYYVLMDTLDRPNLRRQALRWLGAFDFRDLGRHRVELAYALSAIAYILVLAVLLTSVYRVVLQERIAAILPGAAGWVLGWSLAALAVASAVSGLLLELRESRAVHP
jgi:CRP-like cAMP-binding protein/Zn-dependent protease